MYNALNDNELFNLVKSGDSSAFTAIYERHWRSLFITAHTILQQQHAAEDAIQEVFIDLWRRKQKIDIIALPAYLHQAVRFQVFKAIRSRKTDERFYVRLAEITADIMRDDPLVFKEHQDLLDYLITRLPEDCREPFRLSRKENLSYKEIADFLNISEKTVEKKVSKSLSFLRTHYSYQVGIWLMLAAYSR